MGLSPKGSQPLEAACARIEQRTHIGESDCGTAGGGCRNNPRSRAAAPRAAYRLALDPGELGRRSSENNRPYRGGPRVRIPLPPGRVHIGSAGDFTGSRSPRRSSGSARRSRASSPSSGSGCRVRRRCRRCRVQLAVTLLDPSGAEMALHCDADMVRAIVGARQVKFPSGPAGSQGQTRSPRLGALGFVSR